MIVKFNMTQLWAICSNVSLFGAAVEREIISDDLFERLNAAWKKSGELVNASSADDVDGITVDVEISDDDAIGIVGMIDIMRQEAEQQLSGLKSVADLFDA